MKSNCFFGFIKGTLYMVLWLFDLFLLYVSGDTVHRYMYSGGPVNFIVQESFILFVASVSLPAMCFISIIPNFLTLFCLISHVVTLIIRVSTIGFTQDDYGIYPEEKNDYYIESIFILVDASVWLLLVISDVLYPKMKNSRVDLFSVILRSRSQQKNKKKPQLDAVSVTASLPSYISSEELPEYDRGLEEETLPRYYSPDRSQF